MVRGIYVLTCGGDDVLLGQSTPEPKANNVDPTLGSVQEVKVYVALYVELRVMIRGHSRHDPRTRRNVVRDPILDVSSRDLSSGRTIYKLPVLLLYHLLYRYFTTRTYATSLHVQYLHNGKII
jgi:hypothetical protein